MSEQQTAHLTARQRNELEYHSAHAHANRDILSRPFAWDVLQRPSKRWWNAYWRMYAYLTGLDLSGKRVLIVGCGFGEDALRVAKLGADVYAFDLSPESLEIAEALAAREGLRISFEAMPAEHLNYLDDFFHVIVARDIFHHIDIPRAMREIARVAKPGALLVANEVYSHSLTDRIRRSTFVERHVYPKMQRFVYGSDKPYITADERKLSEIDEREIVGALERVELRKYFNFLVTRVIPDRWSGLTKLDRLVLIVLGPLGRFVAGRMLLAGPIAK